MPSAHAHDFTLDYYQLYFSASFIFVFRLEMTKYYVEAKDNVRFLSTLERHFKNLTLGNSFQNVLDTIPSLMNALHMVWIISRHYNKDERMVPLMERIAWEVAERVARVINIRKILRFVIVNTYLLIAWSELVNYNFDCKLLLVPNMLLLQIYYLHDLKTANLFFLCCSTKCIFFIL